MNFVDMMRSAARKRVDSEAMSRTGTTVTLTMEDLNAVVDKPDPFKDLIIPDELQEYIDDLENERS